MHTRVLRCVTFRYAMLFTYGMYVMSCCIAYVMFLSCCLMYACVIVCVLSNLYYVWLARYVCYIMLCCVMLCFVIRVHARYVVLR